MSKLANLRRDGYVIIPNLLSPSELAPLRDAAARLTAVARSGGWPHVRTVGKQFPPWDGSRVAQGQWPGIWGVQHLLHPDLPVSEADRDLFVRAYFSRGILAVARELLLEVGDHADEKSDGVEERGKDTGREDDDGLVMELWNMLVRPDREDFALRWHRDDIPPEVTPEEEVARLVGGRRKRLTHTQWNLPLFDDDSLIVVPGSHARARTEVERAADPYAESLPGMIRVELRAGDVVFYDNNILHRGVYETSKERMTLHGSVGHVSGSRERARNVLQHGVGEWVDKCDFSGLGDGEERERAERMRRRLVEMGRENQGRDIGYSLQG
ncbi:hypothetical protein N656DRAFT_189218 [Canariomyces notabilis]|uniref:Phytanoyl-CoA dioxygenase n=1 Tax=Canariomyces notabilis TaxID=2074819 RepID=A0AAN6TAK4_9PEZI|nr:hypothetical protein N656DRAFT_189218 [Canariomyces arenarius]